DEAGVDQSKSAKSNFTPDDYTQSNGFKNGSYNAVSKEITWNIGVNYNLQTVENASVEDFILGNQKLIKDSIEVYEMSLTGGSNGTEVKELIPGVDYAISWVEKDGNPGFLVKFNNTITKPYMVTYKTSLRDAHFVNAKYSNTATVYEGTEKVTDLNATVSIPHGGAYTTKSGKQNGKIIDWSVNINFAQSKVTNATIIDTPSTNQSLLEQSFHLYATEVAKNGTVKKGDLLTLGEDYTLEFSEDPYSFKLKFTEEISEPYILEYQSLILAKPGDHVNNAVKFSGENVEEGVTESSSRVEVRYTSGMGTGKGEIGRLTVTKTDATTGDVLNGATFTLKDADSGTIIKTATTDEHGVITFDRLLFGDYLLIEEEAPDGYLIINQETFITI
ncbi:hypothetical protein J4G37_35490, partial [Microvirga sp. 3-52]|nr:hypothetical protein [Microvirga sp. 3-52]